MIFLLLLGFALLGAGQAFSYIGMKQSQLKHKKTAFIYGTLMICSTFSGLAILFISPFNPQMVANFLGLVIAL
jgi:hypothetical protein